MTSPDLPLEPHWTSPIANERFNTPVVADGRVFAASKWGDVLLALDVETGQTLWEHEFDQALSDPAATDGAVYVKDAQSFKDEPNLVRAFDAASGEQIWAYELAEDEDKGNVLVAAGESVYVAASEHLLALDAETGKLAWQFTPGRPHRRLSSIAIGSKTVYVSAHTTRLEPEDEWMGTVFALDPAAETIEWTVELTQAGDIALAGNTVVVRDLDDLYAFDAVTGEQQWKTDLRSHVWERRGSVPLFAVANETVYYQASSADNGVAIEAVSLAEGNKQFHIDLGHHGALERTPLLSISYPYLYAVTTIDDDTHAIDVIDLEEETHLQTLEPTNKNFEGRAGAPVIAEQTLFVSGGSGGVVAAYR